MGGMYSKCLKSKPKSVGLLTDVKTDFRSQEDAEFAALVARQELLNREVLQQQEEDAKLREERRLAQKAKYYTNMSDESRKIGLYNLLAFKVSQGFSSSKANILESTEEWRKYSANQIRRHRIYKDPPSSRLSVLWKRIRSFVLGGVDTSSAMFKKEHPNGAEVHQVQLVNDRKPQQSYQLDVSKAKSGRSRVVTTAMQLKIE